MNTHDSTVKVANGAGRSGGASVTTQGDLVAPFLWTIFVREENYIRTLLSAQKIVDVSILRAAQLQRGQFLRGFLCRLLRPRFARGVIPLHKGFIDAL